MISKAIPGVRGHWLRPASLIVAAGLAVALPACGNYTTDQEALHLNSPTDRHPIGFRSARAQLDVELPPESAGLSPNQRADVTGFLDRYLAESTGALHIATPGSGRAASAVRQIREIAAEAGVDPRSVRVDRTASSAIPPGALRLGYARREVLPPECGDWSEDLGRDHARVHYPNFGCATQRNLALNVANPRDLVRPQPEGPASGERRYVNWTKYVGIPASPGGPVEASKPAGKGASAGAAAKQ